MIDSKQTWWIWGVTNQRLSKWALALLHGRHYTIRLQPEGTGCHSPRGKIIQVNPQLFPDQPVDVQFRLTQGLLAHECGHAWFTSGWSDQSENALQELANMLEDERIERSICALYPGVAPAIRLLGDLVYSGLEHCADEAQLQAYTCCLAWRWAHSRTNECEMFTRLKVSASGQRLWTKIQPLVEQAWTAPDTQMVISLGREILRILGLPTSTPRLGLEQVNPGDIPIQAVKPLPLPLDPSNPGPGLGIGLGDEDLPIIPARGNLLEPKPYLELEEKVRPRATRLADALREPRLDQRQSAHEYRGRYNFRQELRTPNKPHLAPQEIGQASRSLALYVLVDRSGSMHRFEQPVKEALMTIYLASIQVGIPLGIAYFGQDDFYAGDSHLPPELITVEQTVAEVAQLAQDNDEAVKALIAGYNGWSNEEYLDWGLRKAKTELRARPERLRVLIIIHDGEPIYRSSTVSDWDLSLAHLCSLEQAGIFPIGVHLGTENLEKLHRLFPRLVNCPEGEALPDKLGSMLCSLA
jgi:hypothetical protein